MNEPRRRGTEGDGQRGGTGGRGRWTRREFLAAGAAAGLAALGLAGTSLTAAPSDPAAPAGRGTAPGGPKRVFTHRGKKVEILEDADGADLTIDGKKRVRAKKVSGMYRAPHYAFLPAHDPDGLAKALIDYEIALEAKAAGATAGTVGTHHAGGH